MPHKCTRCKEVFEGGKDLLKGCPSCGWNKFEFVVGNNVRSRQRGEKAPWPSWPGDDPSSQPPEQENRSTVINKAMGVKVPPGAVTVASEPVFKDGRREGRREDAGKDKGEKGEKYMLSAEREKAVESIRIFEPGTYELNLPSLFEREELVMSVKDGTYLIDLGTAFRKAKKD